MDTQEDKKDGPASPGASRQYALFEHGRSRRRQVVGFDLGSERDNRGAMLHHAIRNYCSILGECDKSGNLLQARRASK